MPYINQTRRNELDDKMSALLSVVHQSTSEEMNYIISTLLQKYIEVHDEKKLDYSACNTIVGVLECVKLEFYNKLVTPFQNTKLNQNGKIYKEYQTNLSNLKNELKKVKDEIDVCNLIYSLHGCDSWEEYFSHNVPELETKLYGIQVAIDELEKE
jgi:hypothetical protein